MSERCVTESVVEEAALAWLEATGWLIAHGPEIAPDMPAAERADYGEVVLARRRFRLGRRCLQGAAASRSLAVR